MRHLADMPRHIAAAVEAVLVDIDDTLTDNGRLVGSAFQALEDLHAAGLFVAPVTGRPAGWCDLIARQWPVHGVVGENGAFYYSYDSEMRRMNRAYALDEAERTANRRAFAALAEQILAEVPGCAISADQPFRLSDLAIDFCEDVPRLKRADIRKIKAIFERAGATAKISSIHVNGWFGRYDKLTMTRRLLRDRKGMDIDQERQKIIFCGDSPNDAPMFAHFPNACGVANITDHAEEMDALPAYVTRGRGGEGFAELGAYLLQSRAKDGINRLRNGETP